MEKEDSRHVGPRANGSRPGALVRTQGYPNVDESSGATALADSRNSHDKTLWIIGDYAYEMAGVAHSAGYQTGNVQLLARSVLVRSNVQRELKQIDSEKPDLLAVGLFIDGHGDYKRSEKAIRILVALMERQIKGGRQLLVYGHDCASIWANGYLAPFLRDARIQETRFRWCNLVGPLPYATGPGFRSVTKVFSNVKLWDGPDGGSQMCNHRRDDHAVYEEHLAGPLNYGRRKQIWQSITYYLLVLVNSGVPLVRATRPWGARPELQFPELLRKPKKETLPKSPTSAHVTSNEAGGGKSHQPKRKKEKEEEVKFRGMRK